MSTVERNSTICYYRHAQDLSFREIAQRFDLSANYVRNVCLRADREFARPGISWQAGVFLSTPEIIGLLRSIASDVA